MTKKVSVATAHTMAIEAASRRTSHPATLALRAVSIRQAIRGNAPRAEQREPGVRPNRHIHDPLLDGGDVGGGEQEDAGRVPVQRLDGRSPGATGLVAIRRR